MSSDKTKEVSETEIESAKRVIKLIKEMLEFSRDSTTVASAQEIISGLTYLSSENLVKHSKHLTWLTIALLVAALGMIGLAIWQSVVLSQV